MTPPVNCGFGTKLSGQSLESQNKIPKLKSSYDFSFDISSFNAENPENYSSDEALKKEFIQFVENSIDNFVNKSKTHDKSNGFGEYIPLNA